MRRTLRQLATANPSRYLESGAPTGLTGLVTHGSPRSTLRYLYHKTLEKLELLPESSLYRQSTEALTKHRLKIVESIEPEGQKEWDSKVERILQEGQLQGRFRRLEANGVVFVRQELEKEGPGEGIEWDDEPKLGYAEGQRTTSERMPQFTIPQSEPGKTVELPPELQLTVEQISEVETRIGAGLIEEVIEVAQGELKLVNVMQTARVWEGLEEKGDWKYFERDAHTKA